MGRRNRKRTRKSTMVSDEDSVIDHYHNDLNGDVGHLEDSGLDSGTCKKPREDYEATGDISVDFPEDVELDVGTEANDGMLLMEEHSDQEYGHLSSDCDPKHSDSAMSSHSDSAIIKSEIFDPAYDMHQYLASGAAEYDLGLLNGIDPLHTFNMKQEPLEDGLLNNKLDQHVSVGAPASQVPLSLMSVPANCLGATIPMSIPNTCVGPSSSLADSLTTPSQGQNALNNAILASPVLLPSGGAINSAFAQIAKIEPGADGKGYVLHLSIPTMAGGQVAATPEALLGAEPRLLVANTSQQLVTPGTVVNHDGNSVSPAAISPIDGSTASLSPSTDGEVIDPSGDSPEPDIEGDSEDEGCDLQQEDLDSANTEGFFAGSVADTMGSGSSDDGSNAEDSRKTDDKSSGWVSSSGSGGSSTPANYEDPDVERFVICSDGPMECVLCSFKTESYSAFKSHIICSHPCWRITKKLSKNRLLVEKSVRMSVNIAQPNLPVALPHLKKTLVQKELEPQQQGQKSMKSNSQSTRRKQMIERNKRLFKCSHCFRLFVFEGSIVNHLLDHHMVKKPYDYIQVSNDHGKTFGLIHRCPYKNCFASCASLEELERHKTESHAQYVFRCQICGFTADTTQAVTEHASAIHQQVLKFGLAD